MAEANHVLESDTILLNKSIKDLEIELSRNKRELEFFSQASKMPRNLEVANSSVWLWLSGAILVSAGVLSAVLYKK